MEQLPMEMIEQICTLLSPQDIAACCAVNKAWREIFNQDFVWKRNCRPHLVEHLKTADCKVEPKFVSPESEDSSLSPVSEWRMNFMRENHLWRNWRTGNRIAEDIIGMDDGDFCHFVSNRLVLWMDYKNKATLVDVGVSPFLEKGEPFDLLESIYGSDVVIFYERSGKQRFVIVKANLVVLVYNMGSPVKLVWELEHVFVLNTFYETALDIAKKYAEPDYEEVDRSNLVLYLHVIENNLVAITNDLLIHIWDVEMGRKLKEDYFLVGKIIGLEHDRIGCYQAENMEPYFVVLVEDYLTNEVITNVYIYSLDNLKFLPFNVEFKHELGIEPSLSRTDCTILGEVVAILYRGRFSFYKFKTSELIATVSSSSRFHVVDYRVYFVTDNRIESFNAATEALEPLPPFDANKEVKRFDIVCDKFLLVTKMNDLEEIWEIHKMSGKTKNLSKINLLLSVDSISCVLGFGISTTHIDCPKYLLDLNESCTCLIYKSTEVGCSSNKFVCFW